MSSFVSYDGTRIGYHTLGNGLPLVCLPGGPGRTGDYLGDLGGLSQHRQLVIPDTRGTGLSETPTDTGSYRCDRLVEDVEWLRAHLGLDQMGLLGHSAAGNLATLYAAAYPERVARLILLTTRLYSLGVDYPEEQQRAALERRSAEPWYPAALAAVEKLDAGDDSEEAWRDYMPFLYGRWDDAARAHVNVGISERNRPATEGFRTDGAFNPPVTRAAVSTLDAPVLMYAGELDTAPTPDSATIAARLFPNVTVTIQPGAAHFPWLDDPAFFVTAIMSFLG
jgi:pimeloyl-ACP methyl ester carboxylesterase